MRWSRRGCTPITGRGASRCSPSRTVSTGRWRTCAAIKEALPGALRAAQGLPPGRRGRRGVVEGGRGCGPPDRRRCWTADALPTCTLRAGAWAWRHWWSCTTPTTWRSAASIAPPLIGINCRDLAHVQRSTCWILSRSCPRVTWKTRACSSPASAPRRTSCLARSAGFDGVLVGETAMRDPAADPRARARARRPPGQDSGRGSGRGALPGRPLVKICGITRAADAEAARDARRRRPRVRLRPVEAPGGAVPPARAGRTWTSSRWRSWSRRATRAGAAWTPKSRSSSASGLVDAVQFHGDETPDECAAMAFPYYKAVRVREPAGRRLPCGLPQPPCPRRRMVGDCGRRHGQPDSRGARGERVTGRGAGPLWLAGGLRPENVGEVLDTPGPGADRRIQRPGGIARAERPVASLRSFFEEIRKT